MSNEKFVNLGSAYITGFDQRRKLAEALQQAYNNFETSAKPGIFLTKDGEDLPLFGPQQPIEKVFSRTRLNGSPAGGRILFTKDNYGPINSGLGGGGNTQCEAIDIVVGTLGNEPRVYTSDIQSRANFASDAARIYLTERGAIEHYFGLKSPTPSISSAMKSGIGIKADHTYVIGREEVRLLVGPANFAPKGKADLLATGQHSQKARIILGNAASDEYEPAVRGTALKKYLKSMREKISKLAARHQELETKLIQVEVAFARHFHQGGGVGVVVVAPDPSAAVPQAIQDLPKYLNDTLGNIIYNYNILVEEQNATGIAGDDDSDILKGANDICSSTVFIGK
jgi:hypothetical protein